MPEPQGSPDGIAVIAFVYSQSEAAVLIATLRAYDIGAVALDQGTISVVPTWLTALGGIRVAVPGAQRDDAIALLYEADGGWTVPPRPYARQAWLSVPLTILLAFMGVAPPSPRIRGDYAWRRSQAPSGSPPR